MQIAVASGKGGTGKTLIATSLARVLADQNLVIIDADVEEPNAGLFLSGELEQVRAVTRQVPVVDEKACTLCGKCAEVCNFNALVALPEKIMVLREMCHSCGACAYLCPERAIKEDDYQVGTLEITRLNSKGRLVTGRLSIGEAISLPVIKAAKNGADEFPLQIIDCPPGTTCPMIEAVRDSDFCLLITEPTPFGVHDLSLSFQAVQMLDIPAAVIINRWNGDDGGIEVLCEENGFPIIARIPFSRDLARAYARGVDPFIAMPDFKNSIETIARFIPDLLRR